MTITDRLAIVGVFVLILAVCFVISARKKPVVLTEARAEADAQVIGEYVSAREVTPAAYPREQEPRGL